MRKNNARGIIWQESEQEKIPEIRKEVEERRKIRELKRSNLIGDLIGILLGLILGYAAIWFVLGGMICGFGRLAEGQ